MQLPNYISNLLFRYECVIVPEFGGFVSSTIPSHRDARSHVFYPPTKKVNFNSQLKNNDGLLANYIADVENISFEQAVELIGTEVKKWKMQLNQGALKLSKIGELHVNKDQKIVFTPLEETNYLMRSFGLSPFTSSKLQRENSSIQPVSLENSAKNKSSYFVKYAASVAVLMMLGALTWKTVEKNQFNALELENQETVTRKIQEATFVINNPLPEISLDLVKTPSKEYHLIAGSFAEKSNANRKVKQLLKKGFRAKIVNTNKWGLEQVAFGSYKTRSEAVENLKKIRETQAKDAWLLIK
jgi:hypothetical protein